MTKQGSQLPPPEPSVGRVFVVDDSPAIRRLLKKLLEPAGYDVEEFERGEDALQAIHTEPPDLVLLDLALPGRSGQEVLEEIRSDVLTRLLPVVILTGEATPEAKLQALQEGVTDFIAKPFSRQELLARVRALVLLKQFGDNYEYSERMLLMLAKLIDARDPYTAGHGGRVAEYADRIAQGMGVDPLTRLEIRRAALFHDLGKIVVPDNVLRKPGALTPDERALIEQHPSVGYELLSPMRTMRKALSVVQSHHERLDGSGYPQGISGSAISLSVRIVTVADVFDAVTTERAYRQAANLYTAYEILDEGIRKGWWDGDVFEALRAAIAESGIIGEPPVAADPSQKAP